MNHLEYKIITHAMRKSDEPIVLSSGETSNYYFDIKNIILNPLILNKVVKIFSGCLDYFSYDYICGMATGAIPIIAGICLHSKSQGFYVRSDIKQHGTRNVLEGVDPAKLSGKRVVVVDDVTTTGATIIKVVEAVESAGATAVKIISLVDREAGATELFRSRNIEFHTFYKASSFITAYEQIKNGGI